MEYSDSSLEESDESSLEDSSHSSVEEDCCSPFASSSSEEESNASNRLFFALPVSFFLPAVQADIKNFFMDFISPTFLNSWSDTSVAWTFSTNICGLVSRVLLTRYWVDNVNTLHAVMCILFMAVSSFLLGCRNNLTAAFTVFSLACELPSLIVNGARASLNGFSDVFISRADAGRIGFRILARHSSLFCGLCQFRHGDCWSLEHFAVVKANSFIHTLLRYLLFCATIGPYKIFWKVVKKTNAIRW